MRELANKVAVVTGGGSGIGEGLVQAFSEEGMRVVVADIDLPEADRVAASALDWGAAAALAAKVDVTDPASVEALAERVYAEFGATHVLCNNAGVLLFGSMSELRIEDWRWVLSVNVFGVIHCLTSFLPRMKAQDGEAHIVNTGSPASFGGGGVYGTSKAALLSISESLRDELKGDGIGVSILCPSNVNTRILDAQRNRPTEYGSRAPDPFGTGGNHPDGAMETVVLGRLVCAAIRQNEFYVFNTPQLLRSRVEQRGQELLAALDLATERLAAL